MQNYKLTAIIFGATLVIGSVIASQAFAAQNQNQNKNNGSQQQNQEQKMKVTTKCTSSYGQETVCEASAEGEQRQYQSQVLGEQIAYVDGRLRHSMVDTSLDLQSMIAASGILLAGAGAFAVKRKLD